MRLECDKLRNITSPMLPDGFSFRFFMPGDEVHWARIEASVLEFNSVNAAMNYFEKAYLPYKKELQKRCLFIINKDDLPIATANSWFANSELGRQASLHWVATCPEYQGLGIGKAITKQALINFWHLEANSRIWLHTQTWSYKAIKLYHDLGFNLMKHDRLANCNTKDGNVKIYQNDFYEAVQVLRCVMGDKCVDELINTAK